jgi:hypothetical protein
MSDTGVSFYDHVLLTALANAPPTETLAATAARAQRECESFLTTWRHSDTPEAKAKLNSLWDGGVSIKQIKERMISLQFAEAAKVAAALRPLPRGQPSAADAWEHFRATGTWKP